VGAEVSNESAESGSGSESGSAPKRRGRRRHPLWRKVLIGVVVVLVALTATFAIIYKQLQGNIATENFLPGPRPQVVVQGPLNVLVMGSDTRAGANGVGIGGTTPGLSDTTMLLHLSANRQFAYGVSLPRDAMVQRPPCERKDGKGTDPGGLTQFNAAFAVGGAPCTVKTVETLTHVHIDHFVVVDFVGFRAMVDAINGVRICVPTAVDDTVGHIQLPAGTYTMTGQQALDYVRVRHDLGAPTGDIGRMKRQQSFVSAMIKKVVSAGTLTNPIRLFNFLEAATSSLTTDPGFADLKKLAELGRSLQSVGLGNVQFVTVPWKPYVPDPNRIVWSYPDAGQLFRGIVHDLPLVAKFSLDSVGPDLNGVITPTGSASAKPTASPTRSSTATPTATPTKSEAQKKADAQAAGLCG
jgi:LCP family protein required for cell wall assembly